MISDKFKRFLSESKESRMSLREAKRICEKAGYTVTAEKSRNEDIDLSESKNKLVIDNSEFFIAFMLNPFSAYRKNLYFDIRHYVDSNEWKTTYLNTKGGRKYSAAVREFVREYKPSEMYVMLSHKDGDRYYHNDSIEVRYKD